MEGIDVAKNNAFFVKQQQEVKTRNCNNAIRFE